MLCLRQISRGATALVVCRSTGEAPALRLEQQAALIRVAVSVAAPRVPVIAGCGGPSTEAAADIALVAERRGADALREAVAGRHYRR